jgi:hypothetical protein
MSKLLFGKLGMQNEISRLSPVCASRLKAQVLRLPVTNVIHGRVLDFIQLVMTPGQ